MEIWKKMWLGVFFSEHSVVAVIETRLCFSDVAASWYWMLLFVELLKRFLSVSSTFLWLRPSRPIQLLACIYRHVKCDFFTTARLTIMSVWECLFRFIRKSISVLKRSIIFGLSNWCTAERQMALCLHQVCVQAEMCGLWMVPLADWIHIHKIFQISGWTTDRCRWEITATVSNLKDILHNTRPKWIISFVHAFSF